MHYRLPMNLLPSFDGEIATSSIYDKRRYAKGVGVGYLTQISTLFEHGSIECLSARPPVRPIIALRQLVDILAGYRLSISGRHRHYEIAYQLAFAAAETYVCRTGCRKHTDIPGPALGDIRKRLKTEARKAGFDGCEAQKLFRVARREAKGGSSTDILCKQVDGSNTKVVDQIFEVVRDGRAIVSRFRWVGYPEPADIERANAMPGRENGHELGERPPRFWKTMDKDDRRSRLPTGNIMQVCVAEI